MHKNTQSGQALVLLMMIISLGAMTMAALVSGSMITSSAQTDIHRGEQTRLMAESGIENAILQLLRNPQYSGETMTFARGTVTIVVSGDDPKQIEAIARSGTYQRTLLVSGTWQHNSFTPRSWQEID